MNEYQKQELKFVIVIFISVSFVFGLNYAINWFHEQTYQKPCDWVENQTGFNDTNNIYPDYGKPNACIHELHKCDSKGVCEIIIQHIEKEEK